MHNIIELNPRVMEMTDFIGAQLKLARKKMGLNQKDLAQKIGTDQGTVSKWEGERTMPPIHFHERLSKALNLPANFFNTADLMPKYDLNDIMGEWQTIKRRLEGLENQLMTSGSLPATPVSRFASLLRDADMVTLYACLYLLSGSKEDLEKVHQVIRDEVIVLRKHIAPLRFSSESPPKA